MSTDISLSIPEIQGAGHVSPFVDEVVIATGIVTAVDAGGFYVQDPVGDGDIATADGIFVFTGFDAPPSVSVGDEVSVEGTVSEFIPGGPATNNLSITQIGGEVAVEVLSSGNALPEAIILGTGGRVVPDEVVIDPSEFAAGEIDLNDPAFGNINFNPEVEGIDFFESLEGTLVTVEDPVTISATNGFGETWTVTNGGALVSSGSVGGGLNAFGGLNLNAGPDGFGDTNPERVQLQFDEDLLPGLEDLTLGDSLSDVTGVVDFAFGNFEVRVTQPFAVETPSANVPEVTELVADDEELTIVTYNVLNLTSTLAVEDGITDPDAEQRAALVDQLINNLGSPDIVALQEIQDNDGTEGGDNALVSDATQTLQDFVDAIAAAGGPTYEFFDVFAAADAAEFTELQGGVPSGNIRNAFLYNPERVTLEGMEALTPTALTELGVSNPDAFADTRVPLIGEFGFNGETVTVVNNHLTSRFGSSPIFGSLQPFIQAGEAEREAQVQALNEFVDLALESTLLTSSLSGDQEIVTIDAEAGIFEAIDTGSPATGAADIALNAAGDALSYSLTFSSELDFSAAIASAEGDQMLGPGNPPADAADNIVTGLHFHAGEADENGPVVFGIVGPFHDDDDLAIVENPDGTTTVSGIWEETDLEGEALSAFVETFQSAEPGEDIPLYFNLHTAGFPGGEIRGQILGSEAAAENIVVLGDLNTFEFTNDLTEILPGVGDEQVLSNLLTEVLEEDELSTFNFQGNSQVLDSVFVTDGLLEISEVDVVGINNAFPEFASDHEPVVARFSFADDVVAPDPAPEPSAPDFLAQIVSFEAEAEIVTFDPSTDLLFSVAGDAEISVTDFSDPANPVPLEPIDLEGLDGLAIGGANSVAVSNGIVAVALENEVATDNGFAAFFDAATGEFLNSVEAGALPDNLTFTPDGQTVLVANEGESNGEDNEAFIADDPDFVNPYGSISVIDLSGGVEAATVATADFTAFNDQVEALVGEVEGQGVRFADEVLDGTITVAQDLEPEFITVAPDGTTAFVSLQENNAIAVVDIASATVTDILPLGAIDHSVIGSGIDGSNSDGINIQTLPSTFGLLQPDAIASYEVDGETFFVTANEGDSRDEVVELGDDAVLDEALLAELGDDLFADLEDLEVSSIDGDLDGDGDLDQLFTFGSRSFSIFDSEGNLVFNSGDDFEQITAAAIPDFFNTDDEENTLDDRSDDAGPEPEGVTIGEVDGTPVAFIALERIGGILSYDISDPTDPVFLQYINTREFTDADGAPLEQESDAVGDSSPEGLTFISAADSPSGEPLLVVAFEVSETVGVFSVGDLVDDAPVDDAPVDDGLISGTAGDDLILGGVDIDAIDDTILAGAGDDEILLSLAGEAAGGNTVLAGSGDDTIFVSSGDTASGGDGDDTFFIGGTSNNLLGGDGDDTFFFDESEDNVVAGGAGADVFVLSPGEIPAMANTIADFELDVDVLTVSSSAELAADGDTLFAADGSAILVFPGVEAAEVLAGATLA